MREREPVIQTIKASDASRQWNQLLDKVLRQQARVIVEQSGIPVAAIISTQDLDRLSQLDAEQAERFKVLDRMRAPFSDTSPEEIEREVARAIEDVRQDQRDQK